MSAFKNQKIPAKILAELRCALNAIKDKKGEAILVLDVREKSSITDFLILVTGTADPHIKAIKASVEAALKAAKVELVGKDREVGSGWVIVDAFDFMIHLQTEEMREFYQLEKLWKDSVSVELSSISD